MSPPDQRSHTLRLQLECDPAAVRRAAADVRAFLKAQKMPERDIWACELAFVEGCNNAIQHTPAKDAHKLLSIELLWRGAVLELRIHDHTAGYDFPLESTLPPAEAERGRGLYLIRSLMDNVRYVRNNSTNCLVLEKTLTGI